MEFREKNRIWRILVFQVLSFIILILSPVTLPFALQFTTQLFKKSSLLSHGYTLNIHVKRKRLAVSVVLSWFARVQVDFKVNVLSLILCMLGYNQKSKAGSELDLNHLINILHGVFNACEMFR